jgi:hypothetical protein
MEFFLDIERLLVPVVKWARIMEATKSPTLSLMYTMRNEILHGLVTEVAEVGPVCDKLRASLTTRLDVVAPLHDPGVADEKARTLFKMLQAASLLDVRTMTAHMKVIGPNKPLINLIVSYLASCYVSFQVKPPTAAEAAAEDDDPFAANISAKPSSPLDDALALADVAIRTELRQLQLQVKVEEKKQAEELLIEELDLEHRLERDPLKWWADNAPKYPHLAHVARTILAAPASSAGTERLFSSAGLASSGLRASISPDTLEMCALVRSAQKDGMHRRA